MRKLLLLALAAVATPAFAQFTSGNLVVSVVGDGTTPTSGNIPVSLREFSTDNVTASQVGSDLSLVNNGGRNLTASYGETSEGQLSLSKDRSSLLIAGYDLSARSGAFGATTSPRVIANISASKAISYSTTFLPAVGDGVRDVYSPDGVSYFATGGSAGIMSGNFGAYSGQTSFQFGSLSTRSIREFGGKIYFSGSDAFEGNSGAGGVGVWDGVSSSYTPLFATPNGASPRDLLPIAEDTMYLATSTAGTGLVKMVNSGSAWSASYSLTGTAVSSITRSGNRIYALASGGASILTTVDSGSGFSAWTTLATAAANTRFRGIEFAPTAVPEPATMIALGFGALAMLRRRKNSK